MQGVRRKILSVPEAVALAEHWRYDGRTVVFTNGVFDILHPGHIRYLQEARRGGDVLMVGVNSDRSVKAIKGASRPINAEPERAELLAATDTELETVEGVGESRAKDIREGLRRLQEINLVDRYLQT